MTILKIIQFTKFRNFLINSGISYKERSLNCRIFKYILKISKLFALNNKVNSSRGFEIFLKNKIAKFTEIFKYRKIKNLWN
jgi:hypothetical protein